MNTIFLSKAGQLMALLAQNLFSLYYYFCWHGGERLWTSVSLRPAGSAPWRALRCTDLALLERLCEQNSQSNPLCSDNTFTAHHVKLHKTSLILAFAASKIVFIRLKLLYGANNGLFYEKRVDTEQIIICPGTHCGFKWRVLRLNAIHSFVVFLLCSLDSVFVDTKGLSAPSLFLLVAHKLTLGECVLK